MLAHVTDISALQIIRPMPGHYDKNVICQHGTCNTRTIATSKPASPQSPEDNSKQGRPSPCQASSRQPSSDASPTPNTASVTMAHCPLNSAPTMAVAVWACPLNASPSPLVTLPYSIRRLHIRSLGYQQLCRPCVSLPTCPVQRRAVVLNPNQDKGEKEGNRMDRGQTGQRGW